MSKQMNTYRKTEQQAWLSNTGITDKKQFEKVIAEGTWCQMNAVMRNVVSKTYYSGFIYMDGRKG